jgi:hypothetical protein
MPCSLLDDLDDEDDRRVSSDDDEPFLTQPPSLRNSIRNAETTPFLDSVRRVIDNESEFNYRNQVEYTSPPAPPSIVIPDYVASAIRKELQVTWGCASPRSYQIEAIFHLVYRNTDMMYLIRKTGEGKSLVLQGMASMLKGITITMVPLLGLGSDLESKCTVEDSITIESYHLDEYRNDHAIILRAHLNNYTRKEKTSIILFVSPQALDKRSTWYPVLSSLASRGCISAVCIDEAHATVHNYESFRPEFKTAIDSINLLLSIARKNAPAKIFVPILAMSATFTIADQQSFNQLIGRFPTIVLWGDMDRRNITINVHTSGQPVTSIMNAWTEIATQQPTKQSLVYSNSAAACDGQLLNRLSNAAQKLPFNNGKFLSLTGECGMMLKSFLMASFCGDSSLHDTDNEPLHHDQNDIALPRIWCMPCTSAANCGVSSVNCTTCFRLGPPPSWHEMVQEMGRVDRLHNADVGTNSYNIFLNVNTFISLWMRIHSESNPSVRDRQFTDLFDILRMLLLPRKCYHEMIEQKFERPSTYNGDATCNNNCPFCDGSYKLLCGHISKHQLISILTTQIFVKGNIAATSLVGMISSKTNQRIKQAIWKGNANITAGHVHALVLMLVAADIISLTAPTAVGARTNLKAVQLFLTKKFSSDDDEFETFALYIDSTWQGIPVEP